MEAFKDDPVCQAFFAEQKTVWEDTHKLSDLVSRSGEFDAVFYPGGHGPMFDIVDDPSSIRIATDVYAAGKPVAAVCHGPVALVNVNSPSATSILKGKQVTGFSDKEEEIVQYTSLMPFSLEERLRKESAGGYVKAEKEWGEKVVVDGQVITGQNPASGKGVGEALAKALSEFGSREGNVRILC